MKENKKIDVMNLISEMRQILKNGKEKLGIYEFLQLKVELTNELLIKRTFNDDYKLFNELDFILVIRNILNYE